ncbi:Trypanosomal VSG domain/Trypanosome variant surface glycoprotein C-terminal domain containing protein, putative [Trypanosoma equiperdum]|uniref:Trypanosomal VSG domain/Trypanosome variant surface glycoprotein C-terminal domain containing protein, putative n=1 Tax=Trypanosoma equiperdum TaxID=5694 RepID=A0A1G4IGH8_TRYEQ|nr:Trypanosomal VSG domain/Trypanosome variant surface glycoprotein C-terminal domain containing protein, putative [Trypanosoma equiperdum]
MNKHQAAIVVIVTVLTQSKETVAARGDKADNTAEFNVMCGLVRLCEAGFEGPAAATEQNVTDLFASITRAHTLAGSNITEVEKAIKEAQNGVQKTDKPMPLTTSGQYCAQQVNSTYTQAKELYDIAFNAKAAATAAVKAANGLLNEALYGDSEQLGRDDKNSKYFGQGATEKLFGGGATDTKNCGGPHGTPESSAPNVGKTLINDIICLCSYTSDTSKAPCGGVTGQSTASLLTADPPTGAKTAWATLMAMCPKKTGHATIGGLQAALASFDAQLGRTAHEAGTQPENVRYFLGYAHSATTGCTGAASQICVNYKPKLAGDTPKGIKWRANIEQAISKVQRLNNEQAMAAAAVGLRTLNVSIWQSYQTAFIPAPRTTSQEQGGPLAKNADKHGCGSRTTNSTCTKNNNCKWEGTTETVGTCVADDTKVTTQTNVAGAGPAAKEGAATAGCAGHEDKTACDADKTGDKQNCAWRKGKDGETDEPEKEKCRSSSFLLNKQFALSVVSGAFGGHAFLIPPPQLFSFTKNSCYLKNF